MTGAISDVEIRSAQTPQDYEDARTLSWAFRTHCLTRYPEFQAQNEAYMEIGRFQVAMDALEAEFRAPKGAAFVAYLNGAPVGCLMFHEFKPGIAEVKRLYLVRDARGHGIARRLVGAVLDTARAAGYREIVLDTGSYMQPAIALYRSQGFEHEEGLREGVPVETADTSVAMRRML